jgi:hypothetical protein
MYTQTYTGKHFRAKFTCINLAGVPVGRGAGAHSLDRAITETGALVAPEAAEPDLARLVQKVVPAGCVRHLE